MSLKQLLLGIGIAFLVAFLLIGGGLGFIFYRLNANLRALDAVPLSSSNYQPAALDLVKLCQTDRRFLRASPGFADARFVPASIGNLNPEMLQIETDAATVYWGGGFYHCGWSIERQKSSAAETKNRWNVSFFSEDQRRSKLLETVDMPTNACFSATDVLAIRAANVHPVSCTVDAQNGLAATRP